MQKYYVRVKPNGDTYWHSDPECQILHRVEGPAVELLDGKKSYWVNGKLHRLDGPARIWPNGDGDYWIDGVHYTKEAFLKINEL